jgi:transcription elongation GreA/GreB family factor
MQTIPMTVAGSKALEAELLNLKDIERPRIVESGVKHHQTNIRSDQ